MGVQGLHDNNLHGASHSPMDTCLIHNIRIVDEDYSIDWAIREEAQTLLSHFHLSPPGRTTELQKIHTTSRGSISVVRIANMSGGKKEISNCDPHWAVPHLTLVIRRHVPMWHWHRHGYQTGRTRHNTRQQVHVSRTQIQLIHQQVRALVLFGTFCFIDFLCEIRDGVLIGNVSHHPR